VRDRAVADRRLVIHLDDGARPDRLVGFLESRGSRARREEGARVVVDDCDRDSPGLATLVALVDEWRCAEHVPEAVLELGARKTILRTET
jgi:hypothetical protein